MNAKMRACKILKGFAFYIFIILAVVFALFPILWVVGTSFKLRRDFMAYPPVFIPKALTFEHYHRAFRLWNAWPFIRNSLITAFSTTAITLLLSVPAAYAVVRHRIGGIKFKVWLVFQRLLPPVVIIIPIYLMFSKLGLVDTYIGLILAYLSFNVPFAIWMLFGFFADIPPSIQEAAMIDGCSEMKAVRKVVLPLLMPGLVVVILFCFIDVWNDLLIVLPLARQNTQTIIILVTSSMQQLTGSYFGNAAAIASFAIIPTLIITLFLQKHLIRGMALGGVKE